MSCQRVGTRVELLSLCDESFRCHVGAPVHTELSGFLAQRGSDSIAGPTAFVDALGLAATTRHAAAPLISQGDKSWSPPC